MSVGFYLSVAHLINVDAIYDIEFFLEKEKKVKNNIRHANTILCWHRVHDDAVIS